MTKVLRVFASMRTDGSATRELADDIVKRLEAEHGAVTLVDRDLAADAPGFVHTDWIGANFTAPEERSAEQQAVLAQSDALIQELKEADVIVIASPIYNFGVPAALKAWIDQVCRARVTFRYSENGPVGLLEGKKAVLAIASGGTEVDSAIDFTTPYLRHVLGFIGIKDVTVYAADRQMADGESLARAKARIAA
ncbi:MAG: NAD(P)H-dependent oxidoreductase [Alphaproteobacteria bacterium]|nr:NAD(P)H-dependent oxidoreductase [Alphaproteobacteria bacterium]